MFCSVSEHVALYTYESPEPGDLTFRVGDMILVSKKEGEWWYGSIGDRTGAFPGNYVKPKETDVSTRCSHHLLSPHVTSLMLVCIIYCIRGSLHW